MSDKIEVNYHGGEYGEILDSSRLNYALSKDPGNGRTTEEWWAVKDEAFKEFDRAIAKIKAEAWDEGQDSVTLYQDIYGATMEYADNPYKDAP